MDAPRHGRCQGEIDGCPAGNLCSTAGCGLLNRQRLCGEYSSDRWWLPTFGPRLTAGSQPVNNATGGSNLGAFGTAGKLTDTTTNITIMGARPYNPAEARFLAVDPVETVP